MTFIAGPFDADSRPVDQIARLLDQEFSRQNGER